jgi:hypothetical protein
MYNFSMACRPLTGPLSVTKTPSSLKSAAMAAASVLFSASSHALPIARIFSLVCGSGVFVCWAKVGKAKLAVFRQTYTGNGKTLLTKGWAMKIAHEGRRETFPLGTPNKAAAAARARDIYLSLAGAGWEATLARYKRAKALTREGETSGPRTVGQFLDEVFRTASNQRTVEKLREKVQADRSGDLRSVGRQREA